VHRQLQSKALHPDKGTGALPSRRKFRKSFALLTRSSPARIRLERKRCSGRLASHRPTARTCPKAVRCCNKLSRSPRMISPKLTKRRFDIGECGPARRFDGQLALNCRETGPLLPVFDGPQKVLNTVVSQCSSRLLIACNQERVLEYLNPHSPRLSRFRLSAGSRPNVPDTVSTDYPDGSAT